MTAFIAFQQLYANYVAQTQLCLTMPADTLNFRKPRLLIDFLNPSISDFSTNTMCFPLEIGSPLMPPATCWFHGRTAFLHDFLAAPLPPDLPFFFARH